MKLISDNIKKLKSKKITKPSSYSTKDIFKFWCKNKIAEDSSYFTSKGSLYLNISKRIDNISANIEIKRNEYIELCEKLEEAPYDFYLDKQVEKKRKEIQLEGDKITRLENAPSDIKYIIDFDTFKNILFIHNKQAQKEIIEGRRLNLTQDLGYIEARVIERNSSKRVVDYNETNKRKKELIESGVKEEDLYHTIKNPTGKIKYTIYRVDDDWVRISWDKRGGAKYMSIYEFKPTD
jgi:hypothetical protein